MTDLSKEELDKLLDPEEDDGRRGRRKIDSGYTAAFYQDE